MDRRDNPLWPDKFHGLWAAARNTASSSLYAVLIQALQNSERRFEPLAENEAWLAANSDKLVSVPVLSEPAAQKGTAS